MVGTHRKGLIPGAIVVSTNGSETTLQLPLESSDKFADVIGALETSKSSTELESMGISMTSLEEVFLHLASLPIDQIGRRHPRRQRRQ